MNHHHTHRSSRCPTTSMTQAAAKLLEFFLDAARVLENHYAAQLLRQHHRRDERQCPLWPEDDPPF